MSTYKINVFMQYYGTTQMDTTLVIKKGGTWYHCNDNQIKETNLNQEINDVYNLFYKCYY